MFKNIKKFLILALIGVIAFNPSTHSKKMTPELLWSLKTLSNPQISPDGKTILYHQSQPSIKENKTTQELFFIDADGKNLRKFPKINEKIYNAIWFNDSKRILFQSIVEDQPQVFISNIDGTDQVQLTSQANGVANVSISNDGTMLSFTSDVKLKESIMDKYPDLDKLNALVYNDLPTRHWDTWNDEKYSHLFIYDLKSKTSKDLMVDERYDTPLMPSGGSEQIAWSPDSREIAYTCKKVKDFENSTNSDIYIYDLTSGVTKNISSLNLGYDQDPLYSPDGKWIAYHSQERPGFESDRIRLILYDRQNDRNIELTKDFDYWVEQFVWSPDSKSIYLSANKNAKNAIFEIAIDNGEIKQITKPEFANYGDKGLAVFPSGKQLLVSKRSMMRPQEYYTLDISTGLAKQLTDANSEEFKDLEQITISERIVNSRDGNEVHTWVVYPPNFDPSKKYPVITYCQGGPQQSVSQFWSFGWNFLLMASNGYIVVAPNRRGCPGFGQEWVDAISKDWGGAPMNDILDAVKSVSEEPYIDKNRIAAIGGSAGGYAAFWFEGNDDGLFKCFVSHCGVFNLESMYGSTEELFFPNWENGGPYWNNEYKEFYDLNSPHKFGDKWDSPILIITGELDYRVPYTQSLEAFTLAQTKGIPSKLIVYPKENHWVLHPQEMLLWYREFFSFLDEYNK